MGLKGDSSKDVKLPTVEGKGRLKDQALLHLQAAISLIPYAGGFLSTYFGEIRTNRMHERIVRYIEFFSERISEIEQEKIDLDFLQSEEFAELFCQVADQAARSTTEERIKRFSNILANHALIGAEFRQRTPSIITYVDRISDLDSFVLLSYGDPTEDPLSCHSKKEAFDLVERVARHFDLPVPSERAVFESIIYMDNLGLTWVKEAGSTSTDEKRTGPGLEEFSSWRTPLGHEVVKAITPRRFFIPKSERPPGAQWPEDFINRDFQSALL